jgi:hypothetical protein
MKEVMLISTRDDIPYKNFIKFYLLILKSFFNRCLFRKCRYFKTSLKNIEKDYNPLTMTFL